MLEDFPVKVGDELVECGRVYKVFKVAAKRGFDGKVSTHVFFKPLYMTQDNRNVNCTIPLDNLEQANIRRPVDKKKMAKILDFDLDAEDDEDELDINSAKEKLKKNDPMVSAQVLKSVWLEIAEDVEGATKSKKDILALSIQSLTQEVALTFGLSLEKAEAKLQKAVEKSL
jgi:RNA polymerase-interacting CarD/CdnL/TRCF family regulator